MPAISVNGFINLDSNRNPKSIANNQLAALNNMVWTAGGAVFSRDGSEKFKDNTQWGQVPIIGGISFKKSTDDFYFLVVVLEDGRVFQIKNNDPGFGVVGTPYTEILSTTGASPALSSTIPSASLSGFNNFLYFADGSNSFFSWDGVSANLSKVNDPVSYSFTFTIADAVDATVGAVYEDDDDTSRQFTVFLTKVNGDGTTTLSVSQSAGETRPTTGGLDSLTKVSGTGDATIAYTGVTFTENILAVESATNRLWATGDVGKAHHSVTNNGRDFRTPDAGFQSYDRVQGLKVSNFISFSEGAVIVSEDPVTQRFQSSILTGYKPFDASVSGSEVGQFKIQRLNTISGIIGKSAQELADSVIGLTPSGFISLNTALGGGGEFGLTDQDFLSEPIKDIIEQINFSAADTIISTVDYVNGRYLCAVPLGVSLVPSVILVYDFQQSQPGTPKWSVFSYNIVSTGVKALFSVVNVPFLTDIDGNIFKTNIPKTFTDDGRAYGCSLSTKSFGGDSILVEKDFKECWVNFLVSRPDTQEVSVLKKLDGKLIANLTDGTLINKVEITPEVLENKWDIIGNKWDSGLKWDTTVVNEQLINLKGINGRGSSLQVLISSFEAGLSWGVSSLDIVYENLVGAEGGAKI